MFINPGLTLLTINNRYTVYHLTIFFLYRIYIGIPLHYLYQHLTQLLCYGYDEACIMVSGHCLFVFTRTSVISQLMVVLSITLPIYKQLIAGLIYNEHLISHVLQRSSNKILRFLNPEHLLGLRFIKSPAGLVDSYAVGFFSPSTDDH